MKLSHRVVVIILGLVLASGQALSQQHEMTMQADTADQEMMAGMSKMNHEMEAARMTGNPDRDFVAMMVPHHQGAVDMAQAELRYGTDPALRRLATEIIAAQHKEITTMQRWLATHPAR